MENTIEQYLLRLTGFVGKQNQFDLHEKDKVMLPSLARQVTRGIALTDRQYALLKTRLIEYKNQFESNDMKNLDLALENLARPLRSVDRTQKITVENKSLVVKFPFNKKMIAQLAQVSDKYKQFYSHASGSNEHKFELYEPAITEVVELFKNKKFDIDQEILEINKKILEIEKQEEQYVPMVTAVGLKNVDERAQQLALSEIGEFNKETSIKYWDRSLRYGYRKTPMLFRDSSRLTEHLANRSEARVFVQPQEFSLEQIVESLKDLDRFPLLVTLSRNNEFEELRRLHSAFDFVDSREQILLNRIEDQNNDNYGINSFIKEKNFNTWLDKDIKIVYIFNNSLPKLLLKNDWRPIASLTLNNDREQALTSSYVDDCCDLIVVHDARRSYYNSNTLRHLYKWV